MKPLVEKERLDCRLQRASSVNGWHCSSISASSPSRYPRNAVPQIFAYEPKPGVFRNLNYPAFQSIRIEQVRSSNSLIIITRNTSYWYYICKKQILHIFLKQIQSLDGQGQIISSVQTVLSCSKLIQPKAMNQIIKFLYGKEIDQKLCSIVDLKQVNYATTKQFLLFIDVSFTNHNLDSIFSKIRPRNSWMYLIYIIFLHKKYQKQAITALKSWQLMLKQTLKTIRIEVINRYNDYDYVLIVRLN